MVHIQDTPVTTGTVVRAFGFEDVALQAVPLAFLVQVAHPEPPVGRHLARVGLDGLEARDDHHGYNEQEPQ